MTKKKSILIVAIIAVLVVAISGVSFAAWEAFVKPADQTWTVTANNPGQLKVNALTPVSPSNYNGEVTPAYTTVQTVNVTATIAMTMTASVVVTVDLAAGGTEYVAIDGTATVALSDAALTANTAKDVTITVTFPDLSNAKYYGATFKIVVTLDKAI